VEIDALLKGEGATATEVAASVGLSVGTVSKSLTLLRLSQSIRAQIDRGEISAAAGYQLARVENPAEQEALAQKLISGEIGRDVIGGILKARKQSESNRKPGSTSRAKAKLSGGRYVTVHAGNLDMDTMISVLEELLTRCRSARTKGLSLTTLLRVLSDEGKRNA
jgi:ParB-like chromosome segregation protein Spo0J